MGAHEKSVKRTMVNSVWPTLERRGSDRLKKLVVNSLRRKLDGEEKAGLWTRRIFQKHCWTRFQVSTKGEQDWQYDAIKYLDRSDHYQRIDLSAFGPANLLDYLNQTSPLMLNEHPEMEQCLRQEILEEVDSEYSPTSTDIRELSYLRALDSQTGY